VHGTRQQETSPPCNCCLSSNWHIGQHPEGFFLFWGSLPPFYVDQVPERNKNLYFSHPPQDPFSDIFLNTIDLIFIFSFFPGSFSRPSQILFFFLLVAPPPQTKFGKDTPAHSEFSRSSFREVNFFPLPCPPLVVASFSSRAFFTIRAFPTGWSVQERQPPRSISPSSSVCLFARGFFCPFSYRPVHLVPTPPVGEFQFLSSTLLQMGACTCFDERQRHYKKFVEDPLSPCSLWCIPTPYFFFSSQSSPPLKTLSLFLVMSLCLPSAPWVPGWECKSVPFW